jgi:hypothetical protein
MKPLAVIIAVIILSGMAWLAIPPAEHVWNIDDVSIAQECLFSDKFHSFSSGLLAVRIVGNLTEPAQVETPLGPIELPRGEIDLITYAHEAWSSSATVRYAPSKGTKGNLKISMCLGACPNWVRRPPPSALPVLYTGGWTTYYPRTDKKAWSGGFHHGIKWGEFTFWDEAGNITHKEEWENGKKKG